MGIGHVCTNRTGHWFKSVTKMRNTGLKLFVLWYNASRQGAIRSALANSPWLFFSPFGLRSLNHREPNWNPAKEKTMCNKKSLYVLVALLLASFLGVSAANAQSSCPYTVASLQGNYSVVGTYGANLAVAIGIRHYDGQGNLSGSYTLNEPTAGSTTGARTIATGTQAGTYTVNCNGTGQFNRVLTQSNGTVTHQVDDFVITAAIPTFNGLFIATAIVDAQETPSAIIPGGVFLTRVHTRQPNQ
jgi:hypothetical protein